MTSQFTWWLVMECGCGLSFSTSTLLSSRWCFLVGSSGSLPQHCVLLRAETMADLAEEMDVILVKWLIGLLWCRFLETSFYIILLTPPCPSPSGWVWERVGTRTCVCAYVWALICVENKIKQVWGGRCWGEKQKGEASANTCARYEPRTTYCRVLNTGMLLATSPERIQ